MGDQQLTLILEKLKRLDSLDTITEGVNSLKAGQANIQTELKEVKGEVTEVRSEVEELKKENSEMKQRLRKLEEEGGGTSQDWRWNEAVEYARRVVVLSSAKKETSELLKEFPEDHEERTRRVKTILERMGVREEEMRRYNGMRIYQTNNGKNNNKVNIELESHVHASQILRARSWKGDEAERVNVSILIPEPCYDRYVELDKVGYNVRELDKEFRYDIRYVGNNMVLYLKPGKKMSFHPVNADLPPRDLILQVREKESKRKKGPFQRGGKQKRKAEVGETDDRSDQEQEGDTNDFCRSQQMTTQELRKPHQSARNQPSGSRKIVVQVENPKGIKEQDDEIVNVCNDDVTTISNVDGLIKTPEESPNKTDSGAQSLDYSLFEKGFNSVIRNYKINKKKQIQKSVKKFGQEEILKVDYGDPTEFGAQGPAKRKSVFIEMNPVYYHEVKESLLASTAEGKTIVRGSEEILIEHRKPIKDKEGLTESHEIKLLWKNRESTKVIMYVYHTTYNMRIQGKKAEAFWKVVMRPIYEEILQRRAEELSRMKNLARDHPHQAACAITGIKEVQRVTKKGVSYTSPKPVRTPERSLKCDLCKEGNIKKVTVCKSCKVKSGHAMCLKNQLCDECRLRPEYQKRKISGSQNAPLLDPEKLVSALVSIGGQVNRTQSELLKTDDSQQQSQTPTILTPPPTSPQDQEESLSIVAVINQTVHQEPSTVEPTAEEEQSPQESQEREDQEPKQQRRRRLSKQTMPRPEVDDLRVTSLESQLAIAEEDAKYWRRLSEEYKRAKDRETHGSGPETQRPVTVTNMMSVNVKSEKITVEQIDTETLTVQSKETDHGKIEEKPDEKNTEETENSRRREEERGEEQERGSGRKDEKRLKSGVREGEKESEPIEIL